MLRPGSTKIWCNAASKPTTTRRQRAIALTRKVFILGLTHHGKPFRPSDWAERLAGVMSSFRPGGSQPGSHLSYSPWCLPAAVGDLSCVAVHHDLRDHDVMAWDFCMNFARDNGLQVTHTAPMAPG